MSSIKYPAFGTSILAGAAATPTTPVLGIKELSFNGGDRAMINTTTQDNTVTESAVPHPLRTLRSMDVTLDYDPADTVHERMRAAHAAKTLEYQSLVLPDAGNATWAMSGYITKFSMPTIGLDGELQVSYTFNAISAETFTA